MMSCLVFLYVLFLSFHVVLCSRIPSSSSVVTTQRVLLDEAATWTLTNSNQSFTVPATVPGGVYLDLLAAGVFNSDPYYRFNEEGYNWVAFEDWTYNGTISSADLLAGGLSLSSNVDLVLHGVDTAASVYWNGGLLGQVNNMFRTFIFSLNGIIESENTLTIVIQSPVEYGAAQLAAYPYDVPLADGNHSLPNRQFIRKAQSDFGWDWGPSFANSGIWRSVELVSYQQVYHRHTVVHQYPASSMSAQQRASLQLQDEDVLIRADMFVHVAQGIDPTNIKAQLSVNMPQLNIFNSSLAYLTSSSADVLNESMISVWLRVPAPALWWPAGYGQPTLYQLNVTLLTELESFVETKQVGFKTVQLMREPGPDTQPGLSFTFRINGVDVFIKGANMIPFDSFHTRVTYYNMTQVLQSLLEANGNSMRVWGGGIYQPDELYDWADQNGILIWQEFAFACSMYPRDDAFLANVRAEVTEQVRRLSSHGSMMVFGGNNENEAALNWYQPTIHNRDLYLVDYWTLYVETVRDALRKVIVDELPFVVSSPSQGPLAEVPFVQRWGSAQSQDYGDMHYYNYADDCANITFLPRARFISEFGFQSHPSLFTYDPVISDEDYGYNSTLMNYRQRHPDGNPELLAQMQLHFNVPTSSDPRQNWDDWIYTTQAVQSLCYRTAFEYWRSIKRETPGRTMGIIYWQLNDIWQGPTWSSLEYGARWKMLHYFVKRAYSPVIVAGHITPWNTVKVYMVSDHQNTITGIVNIVVTKWTTGETQPLRLTYQLDALDSFAVAEQSIADFLKLGGCASAGQCFIELSASATDKETGSTIVVPDSHVYLAPLVQSTLQPAHITITQITPVNSSPNAPIFSAIISLQSDFPAAYVFLETSIPGRFEDNGFHLSGNFNIRTLAFNSWLPFDIATLQQTLKVRSIADTYEHQHSRSPVQEL